jgi:predicted transcriptional regulator
MSGEQSNDDEIDVSVADDAVQEIEAGGEDETDVAVEDVDAEDGRIAKGRERLEEEADRAVDQFDQGIVDLLSWVLDTETRARIYVYLRQHSHSTSEEIAEGTGLYPSTVRESLAELHEEETVERRKRESEGAGNNPYEYTAIAPSELVGGIVGQIQDELNTVFNLDDHLASEETGETSEPVSIRVEDEESGMTEDDETESGTTDDEAESEATENDEDEFEE